MEAEQTRKPAGGAPPALANTLARATDDQLVAEIRRRQLDFEFATQLCDFAESELLSEVEARGHQVVVDRTMERDLLMQQAFIACRELPQVPEKLRELFYRECGRIL